VTAPSTPAMVGGVPTEATDVADAMMVAASWLPPCQPPPPIACTRLFQLADVGSHTSMPIPAEVDGAPAGPGLPGPTLSFTKHMSLGAVGVEAVAVPPRSSASPFLNAFTARTLVFASGRN